MSLIKIDNLEQCLQKLRQFLPEYLLEHGLDITNGRKIKCINPLHDDSSPSMSAFDAKEGHAIVKCFSCNFVGDIFNAAHILEQKPLVGPGFIEDTVMYLAKKYGVEVPAKAMSDDEIFELNMLHAYKAAADYISKNAFEANHFAELQKRKWDEKFVRSIGIGACTDYDHFRSHMKQLGYSAKFLDEIDLNNENIFNPQNLIFTIHDDYGRPVAFIGRNLNFDGVKDPESGRLLNGPKFSNTKTTGMKCNIYKRAERLYLLHIAKDQPGPVYGFEGQGDVVTAHAAGLASAVAISGVGLTDSHFNTLRRNGCYDFVICLDSDDAGMKTAKKILDDVLSKVHDIKIRFLFLPPIQITDPETGEITLKKVDPDIFIRENGIEAFLSVPKIDPFVWRLQQFEESEDVDAETICLTMVPIIAAEPSPIKREGMMRELSEYTGINEKAIRDEIEKIYSNEANKVARAKQAVKDDLIASLNNNRDSLESLVTGALDKLYSIDKEHNAGTLETGTRMNNLLAVKQYQESEAILNATEFGFNHTGLAAALSGDLRQKFLVIGGVANVGKTSMFAGFADNLTAHNDNAMVIMHTIDDSAKEFIPRVITFNIASRIYESNPELFDLLNINKIATPHLYKDSFEYEGIMFEREKSYKNLFNLAKQDKLIVLDSEDGRTLDFIGTVIKYYRDKYPTRDIFYILDNFHLVSVPGYEDGRTKYKHLSHELKALAVRLNSTIITTAEYRKIHPDNEPSNGDLAESVALEYDSNFIMHLDSEMHRKREKSFSFFYANDGIGKYPIIKSIVGKNKVSGFKGNLYYKFYPEKAFHVEISEQAYRDITNNNLMLFREAEAERKRQMEAEMEGYGG